MNRLFVDTNIVIDLLAKREPFYDEAAQLFSLADRQKIKISTSTLTFANTNYVLRKARSSEQAKDILQKFKIIVQSLSLSNKIVDLALNDQKFKDFEDGLQYYTAVENEQDIIITRNLKDFKNAEIPVMTAKQYLLRTEDN